MTSTEPKTIYLKDYQVPAFLVDTVDLIFDLNDDQTTVTSRLNCRRNPESENREAPFTCFGEEMELLSASIDGEPIAEGKLALEGDLCTIADPPEAFELEFKTRIFPHKNTALEGLYKSADMYCTQCEAEGFRRITYFPDRPDVMSIYSTTIIADKAKYPVLLSNGNQIEKGELEEGRHWVKWADPFKKPSYLFALVAGDLAVIEDRFFTCSGREVTLQIFVEEQNTDKCDHAMKSLKQAMKWDEEVYGREYDLDIFMIVAVDDFNAGAMENKGLNIFNSSLILARPDTATDTDYERIQGVVAHEYFHNWTGNRITCRDWFQLSLKEGLTIFRDEEFSADMTSKTVKRIADVNFLRTAQFAEDSSPMAHQVRPDSYIEINNFYTVTVYHKGGEVIRMISTLLGKEKYFKGIALYFDRHDGQAVTIEDFVKAMEDANEVDLTQFRNWYTQAGTPVVQVETDYNSETKTYTLTLSQSCPATPGQETKEPFQIPVEFGLVSEDGRPILLQQGKNLPGTTSEVLDFRQPRQSFIFENIEQRPVPSVLRGFSAPVKLEQRLSDSDLLLLMAHDSDPFNRWESAQLLLTRKMVDLVQANQGLEVEKLDTSLQGAVSELVEAFKTILGDQNLEKEVISQTLTLPNESYLADQMEVIDVDGIHQVREGFKKEIARNLKGLLLARFQALQGTDKVEFEPESVGIRSLKNLLLDYLMTLGDPEIETLCLNQFNSARTMTDEMKALTFLVNESPQKSASAIQQFYQKWSSNSVVMNIWFSIQAASKLGSLARIEALLQHPQFEIKNPNKVRAVLGAFSMSNPVNFHRKDGSGYLFLTDQILKLNDINPMVAARLLPAMSRWRRHDQVRQGLMKSQLERILKQPGLSKDLFEIASKSLA